MNAQVEAVMNIDPRLAAYIATRDKRLAKTHWNPSAISEAFAEMLKRGVVIVGGRATCGTHVDATWLVLRAWKEVVRKARALGLHIVETPRPQSNAWATKAGGFWEESEYRMGEAA